jgi:hypothetical protein
MQVTFQNAPKVIQVSTPMTLNTTQILLTYLSRGADDMLLYSLSFSVWRSQKCRQSTYQMLELYRKEKVA